MKCYSEEKVVTKVLKNYNKFVRPYHIKEYVEVKVGLSLVNINELDEVTGKFSVIGFFYISWRDPRMSWKTSNYNRTHIIFLPQNRVWKPTLFLRNTYTQVRKLGIDEMTIRYLSSGHATWQPGDLFESVCDVNVEQYPFDVQTCGLTFLAWGYNTDQIRFKPIHDTVDLDFFTPHGVWDVVSTKAWTYMKNRVGYIRF